MEGRTVASRGESLRGSRQRGYGTRAGTHQRRDHRNPGPRRVRPGGGCRTHHRRSRGPARGGRGRRVPHRRAAHVRTGAGRGATRELEGLRESVHGAARHSDRAVAYLHRRQRRASLCRRTRSTDRRQGRRPCGGQGRHCGRDGCRSAVSDRCDAFRQSCRRGGRAGRRRGLSRRRRSELHRNGRRPQRAAARRRRRTTSGSAMATLGPTPAAWAPILRRRS